MKRRKRQPQRPTSTTRRTDASTSGSRSARHVERSSRRQSRRHGAAAAGTADPAGDAAAWHTRLRRLVAHHRRRPADGWPAVLDRILILARDEIATELERIDTLVRLRRAGLTQPELWTRDAQRVVRAWAGDPAIGVDCLEAIAEAATAAGEIVEDALRTLSDTDGRAAGAARYGDGMKPAKLGMAGRPRTDRGAG